tara:strand:- start:202 stop:387 length:186 start_codon:yes stop_codon:yes gene_type:complete
MTRYESLLLRLAEDTSDEVKELRRDVQSLQVELAKLKVRASLWGAAAGVIPGVIITLISLM